MRYEQKATEDLPGYRSVTRKIEIPSLPQPARFAASQALSLSPAPSNPGQITSNRVCQSWLWQAL